MTEQTMSGTPWYLHFWPWFIVVLLGVSVLGSLATVYVAYQHRDIEIVRGAPIDREPVEIGTDRSGGSGAPGVDARDVGP